MLKLNHKKLEVWEKSMALVTDLYVSTQSFPKEELFGLTNQIRRAAISVVSNLAEGSARKSSTERRRFYEISRASLVEIDAQLEIAKRLSYLDENRYDSLGLLINQIFAMQSKLISGT